MKSFVGLTLASHYRILKWISDKTQVFHDKIQEKQKELQPWTAQNKRISMLPLASATLWRRRLRH
jgi:hypothetical protein